MKKILFILLIFGYSMLSAVGLNPIKNTFKASENITIHAIDLEVHPKNWIAIYSQDSNNNWGNVLRWQWTKIITTGDFKFNGLPVGNYQARVFYNNSYNAEAVVNFSVRSEHNLETSVETRKENYKENETIQALTQHMSGHQKDWIAIYPKGSSNAWENVIDWHYLNGTISTIVSFNSLPVGEYEIRVFFKDSYTLEAKDSFKVLSDSNNKNNIKMIPVDGDFFFYFEYAEPAPQTGEEEKPLDWIGIYKKEDSVAWSNVLKWKWLKDIRYDELVHISGAGNGPNHLDALVTNRLENVRQGLSAGTYEARFFRNNSFNLDTSFEFTVE